ncbi:SET and MYND domain-containing protein 4 [Gouania willdenowi]|uniref:Protein-lysine N-methyltransferase SMYD4 n=2 Tax=Gouania willdenowi TaxID=441366 RepID=A0A8C5DRM6_GOUWI|nr:SET and MYND domain-containing protein 4 [Gouania willdenowi]
MDLPCVQWQDHVAQKWIALESESKQNFTSLHEIDEVFRFAFNLITEDDLDLVQSISAAFSVHKDSEKAAKCRASGNCSFKSKNYTAAALHYSQGICFAPQSSEEVSLCYANRSAALYHLQHFQECLSDIDKALKNGYPSHLSHKLEDRRTLCLNYVHEHKKDETCPEKAASAWRSSSNLSPKAAVVSSVEKGRHLVAVERITAGEVTLTDRPYSCVLIPTLEDGEAFGNECRRCHCCLSETLSPVPCDGCSYSRYCSAGCQQEAWEEHHRWECPISADLTVLGVMLQLAFRVTLKAGFKRVQAAREPITDESICLNSDSCPDLLSPPSSHQSEPYLCVFHLLPHLTQHSPSLRFLNAVSVATLYVRLSKIGPPPVSWRPIINASVASSQSPDTPREEGCANWEPELELMGSAILKHMLQLRCNAQAVITLQDKGASDAVVQSSREVRIATAIFPTLSLLNHSCCPNTSLVFSTGSKVGHYGSDVFTDSAEDVCDDEHGARGVRVTVRATKEIPPGQEVLHCYGPHSRRMVTKERQRLLREQYFFLCQCEACTLQKDEAVGRRQLDSEGSRRESGLVCCKCKSSLNMCCGSRNPEYVCSLSSCGVRMSFSDVSRRLQDVRVSLETALQLLEREQTGKALKLLKKTQCQSKEILAENHPLQGELADATARAYATMGDWSNAARELERSAVAVSFQYGEDSIELGQQLFKLTQLHFNGGARGPALSVIPKVRRLLSLHCGPRCPELQELRAMEECLRG